MATKTYKNDGMTMPGSKTRFHGIAIALAVIGTAALLVSIFFYWLNLRGLPISNKTEDWGAFGGFVSGVAGTVIALATLIALAMTLDLQARELRLSRDVMTAQADAAKQQASTAAHEARQSTFFQLLANRRNCIADITLGHGGRDGINLLAGHMANRLREVIAQGDGTVPNDTQLSGYVQPIFTNHRSQIDPMIGSTVQLLRFVLSLPSETGSSDSGFSYLKAVRADFPVSEQVFLMFIGLSDYGRQYEVFECVRDSGILRNLTTNAISVVIPQEYIDRYAPSDT